MKKIPLIFCLILSVLLSTSALAALVDANAAYVSKFIWRGFDCNGTQPAVQPGATLYLGGGGATFSLWGSYNIGNVTTQELTELDGILSYASSIREGLDYSISYTYMTFQNLAGDAAKSKEIAVSLTGSLLPLSPTLMLAYDHDQGNGAYASLSGKYAFSIGSLPAIISSLTVGYNTGQWGANPGLSDGTISLSSSFNLGGLNICPNINYAVISTDSGVNTDANVFWLGVSAASSI